MMTRGQIEARALDAAAKAGWAKVKAASPDDSYLQFVLATEAAIRAYERALWVPIRDFAPFPRKIRDLMICGDMVRYKPVSPYAAPTPTPR